MQYKTTTRLFRGTYQYKIVLICAGAGFFRSGDMVKTLSELNAIDINTYKHPYRFSIKTQDDLDFALSLATTLSKCNDINVRVESPWVSIYTNDLSDIGKIASLKEENVKYISKPPDNTTLVEGTVILPKVNFDYRVTMGKTNQSYEAFLDWAHNNSKVLLTKNCDKSLRKPISWGGSHFYVTGEKTLLMVKMHLGGSITKVERIIKA